MSEVVAVAYDMEAAEIGRAGTGTADYRKLMVDNCLVGTEILLNPSFVLPSNQMHVLNKWIVSQLRTKFGNSSNSKE